MPKSVFSGSLQIKKKAELKEIALALHISDAGRREEIQQRIRKHLDDNHAELEDNPAFSGLFSRRKRTAPHATFANIAVSPASDSTEELSEKGMPSPPSIRHTRSNPRPEATPVPEAREVSMMLKNVPISPPEEEVSSVPPVYTPHKERNVLFTSTPRSILRNIPKPSLELADTTLKTLQTGAKEYASVYLLALKSALSNSLHIWLLSALLELLYILYKVIPWSVLEVNFPRVIHTGHWQLMVPYPPLATFQSSAFWSVLLHWLMPTLIIPAIFGTIISFHPANSPSARVPRVLSVDPATASIARLGAQCWYPYNALNVTIEGIDVIGPQPRIVIASLCVLFAFLEVVSSAPSAFADSRVRQRGSTPRRTVIVEE